MNAKSTTTAARSAISIVDVMTDPQLLGAVFGGPTWAPWRAIIATLFGRYHTLSPEAQALVRRLTARTRFPREPFAQFVVVGGRRLGKTYINALLVIFCAVFRTYRLAPGERGVVFCLAADKKQARVLFRYVRGLLTSVPMLAALIRHETKESISLSNGIDIEIHVSSYRSLRGYTIVAAVADELAYWFSEDGSANPDTEVLNALIPAMATVQPSALLSCISSPYARRGALWDLHQRSHGKDDDSRTLCVQSATWQLNPLLPEDSPLIRQAYADDPAKAAAEWGGVFRTDVESFISKEVVEACTIRGRYELPPLADTDYAAFVDPSGGSKDAFTLAIGHRDHRSGMRVLDAVRVTKPPFAPSVVVQEYAALLRTYRIHQISGDRYAGLWPTEQFRNHGIDYEPAPLPASALYMELLPALNGGTVELLDSRQLRKELIALERRTGRGKDHIDHAPNAHDDLAVAVAGLNHRLAQEREPLIFR